MELFCKIGQRIMDRLGPEHFKKGPFWLGKFDGFRIHTSVTAKSPAWQSALQLF